MLMQAGFWDKPCPVTDRPKIGGKKPTSLKAIKTNFWGQSWP